MRKSSSSNCIALIHSGNQMPFLGQVLYSVLNATASCNAQLILRASSVLSRRAAEKVAESVVRTGTRKLLLIPPYAELLTGSAVLSQIKVAAIATAGALPDMHTVRIDNRSAATKLTAMVIRLGHRRIGFITGSRRHGDSVERQSGYEQALQKADIRIEPELIAEGEFSFESGRRAAQELLDLGNRPTAIVASNDDMAAGALWMAQQRGLKLPDDLSVAGFDDTPAALQAWPPLTVIRQPIDAMVERGVALLMEEGRDKRTPAFNDVVLGYTLVRRASTARNRSPH